MPKLYNSIEVLLILAVLKSQVLVHLRSKVPQTTEQKKNITEYTTAEAIRKNQDD